ncbi:hypothetical protein MAR_006864, partial [Mya arenaria]
MKLIRRFVVKALQHNVHCRAEHIPGSHNILADYFYVTSVKNILLQQSASYLIFCGCDTTLYKGHSFRIGAATSAAEQGLSESQIQRWKSRLIRNTSAYQCHRAKRLHALPGGNFHFGQQTNL